MPQSVKTSPGRSPWPADAEELFATDAELRRDSWTAATAHSAIGQSRSPPPKTPRTVARFAVRATWVWGGIGFASGIVFWHLIGFWNFVAETVYPFAANQVTGVTQPVARNSATPHSLAIRATKSRSGKSPPPTPADAWNSTISSPPSD